MDQGWQSDAASARVRLEKSIKDAPGSVLIDGVHYHRMGPLLPSGFYLNGGLASIHASYVFFHPVHGNVARWEVWHPRQVQWAFSKRQKGGVHGFLNDYAVALVALVFGGIAAASAAGAAGAAAAEAGTLTAAEAGALTAAEAGALTVAAPVAEVAPVLASEFSLAGAGSGVGIGGQSYGLGLSAEAAGVGLQVPAGSASLLAPALTNPLTYSAPAGIFGSNLPATVKTIHDAVKPVLTIGSAVRSLLGGEAPRAAGPRPVAAASDASFASDALWTLGTLAAVVALWFAFSKS